MKSLEEITIIENEYIGQNGRPSLGEAFLLLKERWESGCKDKETSLRLMFLAWYSCSEPCTFTGLGIIENSHSVFTEAFSSLGGEKTTDPEVCYVVGIMAELFPWCMGEEKHWLVVGKNLKERSIQYQPVGFSSEYFKERGAYGEYFAHMIS